MHPLNKAFAVISALFIFWLFIDAPQSAAEAPNDTPQVAMIDNVAVVTEVDPETGEQVAVEPQVASPVATNAPPPSIPKTPGQTVAPTREGATQSNDGNAPVSKIWGTPDQWDNFDGTHINAEQWYVYNAPENTQSRTPSQVQVSNGQLHLVGLYDKAKGVHTSGGTSWNLGRAKYGKWEIRMKAEAGAGFSPTVLLWPDTEVWPRDGEIDIFEGGPYADRKTGLSAVHNGYLDFQTGQEIRKDFTQWHTIGVEWSPEKISYFIDGKNWYTIDNKQFVPSTSSMHVALQNDTGCGWVACPNGSTKRTTTMSIDYVALFETDHSE